MVHLIWILENINYTYFLHVDVNIVCCSDYFCMQNQKSAPPWFSLTKSCYRQKFDSYVLFIIIFINVQVVFYEFWSLNAISRSEKLNRLKTNYTKWPEITFNIYLNPFSLKVWDGKLDCNDCMMQDHDYKRNETVNMDQRMNEFICSVGLSR